MFCVEVNLKGYKACFEFPWKVGIVGFMAYPSTQKYQGYEEAFKELFSDPFFELIEFNFIPEEEWEKVKDIAKGSNKELSLGLQPFTLSETGNISSLNENNRKKAVEEIKRMIEISSKRGIKVVGLSSGADPGKEKREEARKKLVESLVEICKFSESLGANVILETFDRDYDKKQLIGPLEEAAEIAKEVRKEAKNFGLMWDLSHAPMLHETPEKLLNYKEYIWHIHIGCTKEINGKLFDYHPGFYRPGAINKVEEVVSLLRTLKKMEYRGAISFEVKPEAEQTSQEVVNSSKGVLYLAYAKLVEELV